MRRVPLFGVGVAGKSLSVTAQRRLNCYYEIRDDSDKANIVIYGTPGLTVNRTLTPTPNGQIRAVHASNNYLYVVAGSYFYKIALDGSTNTVNTSLMVSQSGPCTMVDNGVQLLVVDGANGYIQTNLNSPGGTFTKIVSAGFPNGCYTATFIAGYFIVENPGTGQFFVSASYDGTTWSALSFATAEQSPDNLVAVDSINGLLCLFGTQTIEWWQLSGALDFPFSAIPSATQTWGLAAIQSRAHVDNSIIFLAQNQQGQVQFMEFQGYVPFRISNSDIENIINGFQQTSDAVALSYLIDGHPMYQVTFPSANRSFLYDALTRMWSEVQTGTAVQNRHIASFSVVVNGQTLVTDYNSPIIYNLSPNTYTDNGVLIKRQIQTRHLIDDSNVIGIDEIFIDMESGVGLQTGQGSNPQIMLQISKDGGRTWGIERWANLGLVGEYKRRVHWRRFGSGRDLVYRFTMTDPVKFVVTYGAIKLHQREQ